MEQQYDKIILEIIAILLQRLEGVLAHPCNSVDEKAH